MSGNSPPPTYQQQWSRHGMYRTYAAFEQAQVELHAEGVADPGLFHDVDLGYWNQVRARAALLLEKHVELDRPQGRLRPDPA
jgi:hypothetical protein